MRMNFLLSPTRIATTKVSFGGLLWLLGCFVFSFVYHIHPSIHKHICKKVPDELQSFR